LVFSLTVCGSQQNDALQQNAPSQLTTVNPNTPPTPSELGNTPFQLNADNNRIIYSFLDQYNLSGKTIVPFVTSGGRGFFNTISAIQALESDATVITGGYSISRTCMEDAEIGVMDSLGLGELEYANQ